MAVRCLIWESDGEKGEEAEELVAEKYEAKGYQVWNNAREDLPRSLDDEIWQVARQKGAPDLLAKDGEECKFVEVKSSNGSLSLSQVKWMAMFGREFAVDVVHLDEDGTKDSFQYSRVISEVDEEIERLKAKRDSLKKDVRNLEEEKKKLEAELMWMENRSPRKLKRVLKNVLEVLENGES